MKKRDWLTESEVRERLELYEEPGITDELYDFGKLLVNEVSDRISRLDTKAASIAAYSLGIITLLVSTSSSWIHLVHRVIVPIPIYAAILAFVAITLAVKGLTLRNFEWFSQDEWLKSECLSSRERLRKYRILTMWGVLRSHESFAANKSRWIRNAQWALLCASVLLIVSLANAVGIF